MISRLKKGIKRIARIGLMLILGLLSMVITVFIVIQLPKIQQYIAKRVNQVLHEEYNIPVKIDEIQLFFIHRLNIKGISLQDHQGTIVNLEKLSIAIKPLQLLNNQIYIKHIKLDNGQINLVKYKNDSVLNLVKIIPEQNNKSKPESNDEQLTFFIRNISFNDISFNLIEEADSNIIGIQLKELRIKFNHLDLAKKYIDIKDIYTEGIEFKMLQNVIKNSEKENSFEFTFNVGNKISLVDSKITYLNNYNGQDLSVSADKISLEPENIDIINQKIKIQKTTLEKLEVVYNSFSNIETQHKKAKPEKETSATAWDINLLKLRTIDNSFTILQRDTLNFSIQSVSGDIDHIQYGDNLYKADIQRFKGEVSTSSAKYSITELKLDIFLNDNQLLVKKGKLALNKSNTAFNIKMSFEDLNSITEKPGSTQLNVNVTGMLAAEDIKQFYDVSPYIGNNGVTVQTNITGTVNKLSIKELKVSSQEIFLLNVTGELNKLLDKYNRNFKANIDKLSLTKTASLDSVLNSLTSIKFPERIDMKGQISGSLSKLESELNVNTSFGDITAKLELVKTIDRDLFTINTELYGFQLGQLLQKENLGKITGAGKISGIIKESKTENVTANMNFKELDYNQYIYNDIILQGSFNNDTILGDIKVQDENINVNISGLAMLTDTFKLMQTDFFIEKFNLKPLHLSEEEVSITGEGVILAEGTNKNNVLVKAIIKNPFYNSANRKAEADSIKLYANADSLLTHAMFNAFAVKLNDSLIADNVNVDAEIQEHLAVFSYSVSKGINQQSKNFFDIQGDGLTNFNKDSVLVETGFYFTSNTLEDSSDYKFKLLYNNSQHNIKQLLFDLNGEGIGVSGEGAMLKHNESPYINSQLIVDSFNIKKVNFLTKSFLNSADGNLNGKINVTGKLTKPEFKGFLNMVNLRVEPKALDSKFTFPNEKIRFSNSLIQFDTITIYDENRNFALLVGSVDLDPEKEQSQLNIKFITNDFKLLDKDEVFATSYYGTVFSDINGVIGGSIKSPDIQLYIRIDKSSEFYFILPQPEADSYEGVFEFVNNEDTLQLNKYNEPLTMNNNQSRINANIQLTDNLSLTLITSLLTNEKLMVKGNGDLNLAVNKVGSLSITGKYELTQGKYDLDLYNAIKREFSIVEGSYLFFTGDIYKTKANISAKYTTKAIPAVLMSNSNNLTSQSDDYNNPIDVQVILNLNGDLLTPDFTFKLKIDDSYSGTELYNRIEAINQDETELYKQAFSLLVFNRFMDRNNINNASYNNAISNKTRESIGNLLTDQLNKFAGQHIEGVNVNFNIESYNQELEEQTYGKTNLGVNVSRKLLNDRLMVQLGGTAVVEDSEKEKTVKTGNLAGDFLIEYKLTPEGIYRLQAFNKNDYDNYYEGELNISGLAIIFNKDFYSFKQLLNSGLHDK